MPKLKSERSHLVVPLQNDTPESRRSSGKLINLKAVKDKVEVNTVEWKASNPKKNTKRNYKATFTFAQPLLGAKSTKEAKSSTTNGSGKCVTEQL